MVASYVAPRFEVQPLVLMIEMRSFCLNVCVVGWMVLVCMLGLVGGKGFRLMRGSMQVSLIGTFLLNNAN